MRLYLLDGKGNKVFEASSAGRIETYIKENVSSLFNGKFNPRVEEEFGTFSYEVDETTTSRDITEAYKSFYMFV